MREETFYCFYTKELGKMSDIAFSLFSNAQYSDCIKYYESIIPYFGCVAKLGMNNLLIYQYCCRLENIKCDVSSSIPPPPCKEDLNQIYRYEINQEIRSVLISKNKSSILSQPKILNKGILAAKIGLDHKCTSAIETGTFLGATSYLFSGVFHSVTTIEADANLAEAAKTWLETSRNNIKCLCGNSGDLILQALNQNNEKKLLFLDAHFSNGITSSTYGNCPLLNELVAAFNASSPVVIVVDDIRLMGRDGWPTIGQIVNTIPEGYQLSIVYDQIIIHEIESNNNRQ